MFGKASDGSIDSDEQIVDPSWMARAAQTWKESGANLRVQHNAQRDPAGVGLEVETDATGATWLKGLVVEPIAKKLVAKGALRAYSVGIARPTIERDATARGGRITNGELVEISLVDRPANKRCGIQLVKSAEDGTPEYVNEVFGAEADIAKALGADVTKGDDDMVNVDLPKGASISISPADFARLRTFKQELVTKAAGTAEADTEKRDVSTAERRSLASEGNALPDGSYPINSTGDLHNAAHLARTGHGDAAAARRLIARRAEELGVANPLDQSDEASKSEPYTGPVEPLQEALEKAAAEHPGSVTVLPPAVKEAEPEVTKDPEPEPEDKPVKKAKKKPKKMPPWLKGDDDGDSDAKDDDASKACKSVTDHLWTGVEGTSDIVCSKCHTTPAQAAGVAGTHDMTCAPVPELMESDGPASTKGATPASASGAVGESMKPVPAHREPDGAAAESFEADAGMSDGDGDKSATPDLAPDPEVAALLRFKATGTSEDLGRLHDLTCPAFHPEQVAKYHPYADLGTLIDSGAWQRKTLAAAAGPLEAAMKAQETWQDALLLKTADPADLNDWRLAAYKAFRDANPGPGSFPTPGCVSPQRYSRPVLTDGRAATATDYGAPNSSPQVATTPPDAHSFDRPPLSSGHQSPSPSFMKASFEYPSETGVPTQLSYAAMQKEQQRQALARMHEHLSRQFPPVCPMALDGPQQAENHPVPQPAGIGKDAQLSPERTLAEAVRNGEISIDKAREALGLEPFGLPETSVPVAAFKAPVAEVAEWASDEVYKGFKKMRKKLGKKVLSGKMTVDEARARMGRTFAQKAADEPQEAVQKSATTEVPNLFLANPEARKSFQERGGLVSDEGSVLRWPPAPMDASAIEFAVTKALAPIAAELTSAKTLLAEQQETFTTKLAEQQRVIDAIADQPDPSTAAFSGLAFQPQVMKSRRPAAVPDIAESAARAQDMIRRNLQSTYQTHSDPYVREAAGQSLATMGVGMEAPPMT